jgi:hypothetical protein
VRQRYTDEEVVQKALTNGRSDSIVMDEAETQVGMDIHFEWAGRDMASGVSARATLEDTGLVWFADDLGL